MVTRLVSVYNSALVFISFIIMKANEPGSENTLCRDFLVNNSLLDSLRESIQSKVKTVKRKDDRLEDSVTSVRTQRELIMEYYKSMNIFI